jgi:hypothetical protein
MKTNEDEGAADTEYYGIHNTFHWCWTTKYLKPVIFRIMSVAWQRKPFCLFICIDFMTESGVWACDIGSRMIVLQLQERNFRLQGTFSFLDNGGDTIERLGLSISGLYYS